MRKSPAPARSGIPLAVAAIGLLFPTLASAEPADTPLAASAPARDTSPVWGRLSAGMGLPYGVFGSSLEFGHEYVTATAGVGTTIFGGPGWSAGGRVYVLGHDSKYRPFASAVYGTSLVYDITVIGGPSLSGTVLGPGFYLGLDHDVGDLGGWELSYALGYLPMPELPSNVRETLDDYGEPVPDLGLPIKLAFGIGYAFGD